MAARRASAFVLGVGVLCAVGDVRDVDGLPLLDEDSTIARSTRRALRLEAVEWRSAVRAFLRFIRILSWPPGDANRVT